MPARAGAASPPRGVPFSPKQERSPPRAQPSRGPTVSPESKHANEQLLEAFVVGSPFVERAGAECAACAYQLEMQHSELHRGSVEPSTAGSAEARPAVSQAAVGPGRDAILRRLAIVLHDSNDAITMQDLDGHILAWNRGAERMYGYSEAEALGMNAEVLVPEEDREQARSFLAAIRRGEEVASLEVKRRAKSGRLLDVWLTITKLVDDEGRPVAVATTERDITERKHAERERERLLDELNKALQARDEFLSIASHELKTPLSALRLKLDLLLRQVRKGELDREKLVGHVEVALRQVARLARLVDELLDVSRITAGRLRLEREEVDLSALVYDVVSRLREVIERSGCSIALDLQSGVVGQWDRLRIEQVLMNLLNNAVEHAAPTPIDVSLRADERQAVLMVRDRGPGIPESEQKRIFERFARAAPRGGEGLGLGLYIARQVVEAHGGRIRLESRPGEGATFFAELPLAPPGQSPKAGGK